MWIQLLIIFLFFTVNIALLLHFTKREGQRKIKERSTAVLDGLQTMRVAASVIFSSSSVPNYVWLTKRTKKFGGLMIVNFPTKNFSMVSIADMNIAKHIMNSPAWISRLPDSHYLYSSHFGKPLGLLFGNGQWWKEARKLTLKLLHRLDFFQLENMERFISYEINQVKSSLDEKIRESGGEATVSMHQMFEIHTLNILYQVIMGKRFEKDDPIVERMLSEMNELNRDFNLGTSVLELFPWLRHIPFLPTYMRSYEKAAQTMYAYFKKEVIEKRRATGNYKTEPKDFADYFLLEVDKNAGKNPCYLTEESFLVCMRDLVYGGTDTTNSVMEHGILHVSLRPEVQRKVQAEIDEVIGLNRNPSYDDRHRMPYTQAVLLEVLRHASAVPLTARSPLEDNEINGDFISKGSLCAVNIYAIHRSKDIWEDPYAFRPERFLNENDEIVNTDKIIPFGFGKRLCVGERVARITLFIFFVTLMQRFTFELSKKHPPPSFKNVFGLSRCPIPYHVTVKSRVAA